MFCSVVLCYVIIIAHRRSKYLHIDFSEEVFDFSAGHMTQAKIKELKQSFNKVHFFTPSLSLLIIVLIFLLLILLFRNSHLYMNFANTFLTVLNVPHYYSSHSRLSSAS